MHSHGLNWLKHSQARHRADQKKETGHETRYGGHQTVQTG
jgi:hypothetical protein